VSDALISSPLPWHREAWEGFHQHLHNGQISHAFLISAEAQSGKRLFATMLAQWLLCETPTQHRACGKCGACLLSAAGSNPDFVIVQPEEKSKIIKIDQIRELKQFIETSSHSFGKRIILLDSAENLNINAANAMLKGLEEPPADVIFLLLSDRPKSVLATISSRCRALKLPKPTAAQSLQWLATQAPETPSEELEFALDYAQGRPLQALLTLEDASADRKKTLGNDLLTVMSGQEIVSKMVSRYYKNDALDVLNVLSYWLSVLVKFQISGNKTLVKGRALQQAATLIPDQALQGRAFSRALLGLYENVCEAQTQVASVSNPNMQLLLEDLLLQLQHLFTQDAHA
jgi:DNA polymerase-3 subunit delta'